MNVAALVRLLYLSGVFIGFGEGVCSSHTSQRVMPKVWRRWAALATHALTGDRDDASPDEQASYVPRVRAMDVQATESRRGVGLGLT